MEGGIPRDRAEWKGAYPEIGQQTSCKPVKRLRSCRKPVERRYIHGEVDGRGEEKGRRGETKESEIGRVPM
jgi:hypothetical protein